jgi:hypothetical protein
MTTRATAAFGRALAAVLLLLAAGCAPITLVQPYDQALFDGTEAVFKEASAMIDEGITVSPLTDEQRAAIADPKNNPASLAQFEPRYRTLATDTDALILRALAQSRMVGPSGEKLQGKISRLIDEAIPSQCQELEAELGAQTSSLTVKNYIDLKCLFVRWEAQHADPQLTRGTQILKRSNWQLRKGLVFDAVLAIQRAELSKKQP